jgi:hypothetical protein
MLHASGVCRTGTYLSAANTQVWLRSKAAL